MRAPIGATGRGSQHAQSMERYFTGVPGLKVVAVSNAYDAKGDSQKLLVRDDNPVLIFEHKLLYGSKGARAEPGAVDATSDIPDSDYGGSIGQGCRPPRRRTGHDPRLAAHGALCAHGGGEAGCGRCQRRGSRRAQPVSHRLRDTSSLVCKTGRVVIVEEGPKTGGVSAEIAAGIMEHCGQFLQASVVRVASPDVPVPFTPVLENAYRPDVARIVEGVKQVLQ